MLNKTFLTQIEKDKNIPFLVVQKKNFLLIESNKGSEILPNFSSVEEVNFFDFCPSEWKGIFIGSFKELKPEEKIFQKLYNQEGEKIEIELDLIVHEFIVIKKIVDDNSSALSIREKQYRELLSLKDIQLKANQFDQLLVDLLLKHSDDAIFLVDHDYEFIHYNQAAKLLRRKLMHTPKKEGVKFDELVDRYERLKIGVSKALKGDEFFSEISYESTVGKPIFLRTHYQPIKNTEGTVLACLVISKDVTARSTIEELFSTVLNQSTIGFTIIDNDGCLVRVNDHLLDLLQLKNTEVIGTNFSDYIHPTLRKHFKSEFKEIISSHDLESPETLFLDLVKRDGESILFEVDTRKVKLSDTRFGVMATLKNATQKEQNNQMLEEMQRLIKACGWVYDRYSKSMKVTNEVSQVIGISQEFVFKNPGALLSMCDESSLKRVKAILNQAYRTQSDFDLELLIHPKYKGEQWVRLTGRPIIRHDRVVGLYGGLQDITQQKKAIRLLERNKTFIDEIQRVTQVGNWVYEVKEKKYHWSDQLFTFLGADAKRQDVPSFQTQLKYIDKHYRFIFKEALKDLYLFHKPIDLDIKCHENLIKHHDREYLNIQGRPIYDAEGKLLRFVGAITDITERKRSEELNQSKKIWLKSMINAAKDSFIAEYSGRVANYNKGLQRLLGYNNYFDLRGKVFLDFFDEKDHSRILKYRQQCRIGDISTPSKIEVKIKTRSKGYIDVELSANLAKIKGKLFTIFNAHDISKRKEFEQGLIDKNKELEVTNKELDRFLYSTTHDLKGPITSIKGLVNLAHKEAPEVVKEIYLPMMDKNVDRILELIKDFGEFLRNNRNKIKANEINFKNELDEIINSHKYIVPDDFKMSIEVNLDDKFIIDKNRLRSILTNLLTNGVKYVDFRKDEHSLNIKVDRVKDGVSIKFIDNGEGIEKSDHQNVFDMFYRASELSEGTGLGLFIVKEAIQVLSGSINLSSEIGVGTEIEVYLPEIILEE
ncbi:PAS domain S-box protein [Flammeovirga pectinis]|uniref:histidine kinase n=1 Tax=Flammeovirga pectinis TaxID=2494373 RepID=A0A3S9P8J8_9BACT|nr:PAS domain S-box protein [Flammeovirga pectinis]AZQ64372.1 PAS domain S-box protein [Flammeovirga pectinis]